MKKEKRKYNKNRKYSDIYGKEVMALTEFKEAEAYLGRYSDLPAVLFIKKLISLGYQKKLILKLTDSFYEKEIILKELYGNAVSELDRDAEDYETFLQVSSLKK